MQAIVRPRWTLPGVMYSVLSDCLVTKTMFTINCLHGASQNCGGGNPTLCWSALHCFPANYAPTATNSGPQTRWKGPPSLKLQQEDIAERGEFRQQGLAAQLPSSNITDSFEKQLLEPLYFPATVPGAGVSSVLWAELCHPPPSFIYRSSNSQCLRMWLCLESKLLYRDN